MAIDQDIENGETIRQSEITEPLIQHEQNSTHDEENHEAKGSSNKGSISMVLISTAVAVCGSFEFGTCVSWIILEL